MTEKKPTTHDMDQAFEETMDAAIEAEFEPLAPETATPLELTPDDLLEEDVEEDLPTIQPEEALPVLEPEDLKPVDEEMIEEAPIALSSDDLVLEPDDGVDDENDSAETSPVNEVNDTPDEEESLSEAPTEILQVPEEGLAELDAIEPMNEDEQAAYLERLQEELLTELDLATEEQAKAPLYYALGELREKSHQDDAGAAEYYQKSFEADPTHLPTLKAAVKLFESAEAWDVVSQLLKAQLDCELSDNDRQDVMLHLAQILADRQDQRAEATTVLIDVLEMNPHHLTAFKLAEKYLIQGKDNEALTDFYAKQMLALSDHPLTVEILLNWANLLEQQTDGEDKAIETYQKVLESDPDNLLVFSALKRLLPKKERWNELDRILSKEESLTTEPERIAHLKLWRAKLYAEYLNNQDFAQGLLEEALDVEPGNRLVLDRLTQLLERRLDWKPLAKLWEARLEQSDNAEDQATLAFQLARLNLDRLEDEEKAITWFEKALESNPGHMASIHALEHLYRTLDQTDKLIALLEREAEQASEDKDRAGRLFLVAELYAQQKNDPEKAVETYRKVLDLLPGYLPAIKALSELYGRLNRPKDLIEMNELLLEKSPDLASEQSVYLLEQNSKLYEELDDLDQAIECRIRILDLDTQHLPSIQALGRLFAKTQRFDKLVLINEKEAELIHDDSRKLALLFKSGQILEEKLNDADQAIEFYQKALAQSPEYIPAFTALDRLLRNMERYEELLQAYRDKLSQEEGSPVGLDTRMRMIELATEKLNDASTAEALFKEILERDPGYTPATTAYAKFLHQQKRWEDLLELYRRMEEASQDTGTKALLLYNMADILENQQSDQVKAIELLSKALELDSNNTPARLTLMRLLTEQGKNKGLRDLLEEDVKTYEGSQTQIPLLLSLADVADDEAKKISCYQTVLEMVPTHPLAFQQLETLLRKQERWEDLEALYRNRLATVKDPSHIQLLKRLIVEIQEAHLHDLDKLATLYSELATDETHPDPSALMFFEEIYIEEKRWDELAELYRRLLEQAVNPQRKVQLLTLRAMIQDVRLGDADEAKTSYEQALEIDPAYLPARLALRALQVRTHQTQDLQQDLEAELTQESLPERKRQRLHKQLADLYLSKRNNEKATEHLLALHTLLPSDTDSFQRLMDLLKGDDDLDTRIEVCERRLDALDDAEEQAELQYQLARWYFDKKDDDENALSYCEACLRRQPENTDALELLAKIHLHNAEWQAAIDALKKHALLEDDPTLVYELTYRIGEIYQDKLEDMDEGRIVFEALLEKRPEDFAIQERLIAIYEAQNDLESLESALLALLENDIPKIKTAKYAEALIRLRLMKNEADESVLTFFGRALSASMDNQELRNFFVETCRSNGWLSQGLDILNTILVNHEDRLDSALKVLLFLDMAVIQTEELNDDASALALLEKARALDPKNQTVLRRQADLLSRDPMHYLDAIDTIRILLERSPFDPVLLQTLFTLFHERSELDKAYCTSMVLEFLNAGTDPSKDLFRQFRERASGGIPVVLPDEARRIHLLHPNERGILSELLRDLAPALHTLTNPKVTPYDLSSCKAAEGSSSLIHVLEAAGYQMGVETFQLYLSAQTPDELQVLPGSPAKVVLGGSLAFAQEGVRRFLAGNVMSAIHFHHNQWRYLGADLMQQFLDAICQQVIPDFTVDGLDPLTAKSYAEAVRDNLDTETQKAVVELLKGYARRKEHLDFPSFLAASTLTDHRLGLLLSGNLEASLESVLFLHEKLSYKPPRNAEDAEKQYGGIRYLRELLHFVISDDYFALRKLLRLNVD